MSNEKMLSDQALTEAPRQAKRYGKIRGDGVKLLAPLAQIEGHIAAMRRALDVATVRTFDSRCADEVDLLVRRRIIDARSPAADALLDYRNPPSTPRSDRLLALEANNAALVHVLVGVWRKVAAMHYEGLGLKEAIDSEHPGAALLEVENLLRQHQRADEPDLLTTLRRLLEERERIAHMVSAEAHRKALVQAKNEGLQAAADHLKALLPEDTIFPATRKIVMTAVEGIIAMKERE